MSYTIMRLSKLSEDSYDRIKRVKIYGLVRKSDLVMVFEKPHIAIFSYMAVGR